MRFRTTLHTHTHTRTQCYYPLGRAANAPSPENPLLHVHVNLLDSLPVLLWLLHVASEWHGFRVHWFLM